MEDKNNDGNVIQIIDEKIQEEDAGDRKWRRFVAGNVGLWSVISWE